MTYNGSAFTSKEFETFLQQNGIQQIRTAPYHPASNGQAERTVKTFKTTLNKMLNKKGTINKKVQRFLMAYCTTAHSATNCTPAELLFGRRLRTTLDIIKPSLSNNMEKNCNNMICRTQNRRMREFSNGQEVFICNFGNGSRWISGVIVTSSGPLIRLIKLNNGKVVIRHADHIQNRYVQKNDETFQKFEKTEINNKLQPLDSTAMPNQSNSPQTTEPTEPTQNIDNSNSPSEEVSEMPLRQSSRIRIGCYKVIIVIMLLTFEIIFI